MKKRKFILLFAIMSLLIAVPGHTEIYKWTDSMGVVHIQSQPPGNKNAQKKNIIMYSTEWCPYCEKARAYFWDNNIKFVEYDVEKLPSRMHEFNELGGTGYPLILIGQSQQMQGFSASGFERRYNE